MLYDLEMTLGSNIARARELSGITQQELGEPFGITPQAVSQWERDDSKPDLEKLPIIANILGVSTDWLLTLDREPPAPDSRPDELQSLCAQLDETQRMTAIGLIKVILNSSPPDPDSGRKGSAHNASFAFGAVGKPRSERGLRPK